MRDVLALVLAGGRGSRLEPLTMDRAKPAVPFGGAYRIIDFTLSNCINSGLRQISVLTQYKAASLDRHIRYGWNFLSRELNEFIEVLAPQQRLDDQWYQGTADAVYQNIYTIEKNPSDQILILSGDHIYKMDYSEMIREHRESGADATVACLPVLVEQASEFGVMKVDRSQRIIDFQEKPEHPEPSADDPLRCLASMGVYVFNTRFLFEELCRDATVPGSAHDFGKNIIPSLIERADVRAYPFRDKNTGEGLYWRDVGTLDSYYEANQDLVSVEPELNLYDPTWPVRTYQPSLPPPKFVFAQQAGPNPRRGVALDSMVCDGSILAGGKVERSIIGHAVKVSSWASVEDSILFDGVQVGREAQIRRAIIDKRVKIPAGSRIGFDPEEDRENGYTVTESGITVVPRAMGEANPNLIPFAETG